MPRRCFQSGCVAVFSPLMWARRWSRATAVVVREPSWQVLPNSVVAPGLLRISFNLATELGTSLPVLDDLLA